MKLLQVDGKLIQLAAHHTASRIIQFCAKHGTPQQTKTIMEQVSLPCYLCQDAPRTSPILRQLW